MPHQCTDCGRSFDDGSTEMLSGCPDCGGTTFQYIPEGADSGDGPSAEPPDSPESPADSSVARTVGTAATAVRDLVGSSSDSSVPGTDAGPDGTAPTRTDAPVEDPAQASARNDVVSPEELPTESDTAVTDRPTPVLDDDSESAQHTDRPADAAERDRPDLRTLREELNDQFESIKVVEPGQYELNLMELYDREEYIIALQEDGKYTIQVPERWTDE
jgi:predicted  nucleic acid-binding Zn-ribbon protein